MRNLGILATLYERTLCVSPKHSRHNPRLKFRNLW
uniref:Uncharacterized protein n=1 Tax=Anguilla anguilla TaxID=7936 RepID=A0A0E9S0A5_ANGAN